MTAILKKEKVTRIKVKYTFEGYVDVAGDYTKQEAKKIVSESFGCICTPNYAGIPSFSDWEIGTHPTKTVVS
jgi:hypothetical protein